MEKRKSSARQPHAMEFNTSRGPLILPEYGRNIQKMVEYCCTIEDRNKRNEVALAIIAVMGHLNPHYRDINEYKHKLWDHIYLMSDFKLDVDAPYPKPTPDELAFKPITITYPSGKVKFKHYGKLLELMIDKASEFEDGQLKDLLVETLANHMKKSYITWNNKNFIDDSTILGDLETLSKGQLKLSSSSNLRSTRDIVAKTRKKKPEENNQRGDYKFRRNPKDGRRD